LTISAVFVEADSISLAATAYFVLRLSYISESVMFSSNNIDIVAVGAMT
jgi:hypothetical protein